MSIIMSVFVFVVTGGSECHADGVNDGSGSSGDGEEAARQSEDDKALWDSGFIFCILYFVFCIWYARARTTKPFGI